MTKSLVIENGGLTKSLDGMKAEVAKEREVAELLSRDFKDAEMKAAKEIETLKSNLEKAISSAVRLTVVAPTVNVTVSEDKIKVKGRLSTEGLRDFIEKLIDNYSTVFTQPSGVGSIDGSKSLTLAPDGVTPINTWLEGILGEVQKSIEQHVAAAVNDTDAGGSLS